MLDNEYGSPPLGLPFDLVHPSSPSGSSSALYDLGPSLYELMYGCDPPERDATGKVHGDLPTAPPDWLDDETEEAITELAESIAVREAEQEALGEDGPHRRRIEEERAAKRMLENFLYGK